jgi:hypothetical protein
MFTPSMIPMKRDRTETNVFEREPMISGTIDPQSTFKTEDPDDIANNDIVGDEIRRLNS